MTLYDTIGKTYAHTRQCDPRIAAQLLALLAPYSITTIADIGAGTGSYAKVLAEQGYRVLAIEPAATMRQQAMVHPAIHWVDSPAEAIALPNGVADAAIIILAVHHFQNPRQALTEIHRITAGGPIVLLTYNPAQITQFWLTQYFPALALDVQSTFWPITTLIAELEAITRTPARMIPFPLPHDLSDAFAAVGWARPELYLDPKIRAGISSFAKMAKDELEQGLSRLREDLETGHWDCQFASLRQQSQLDLGYCFVSTIPQQDSESV
jgi:ubiquinone/menaquinone biosynthesis C-methylase UbiE